MPLALAAGKGTTFKWVSRWFQDLRACPKSFGVHDLPQVLTPRKTHLEHPIVWD